jgi:hypothetical protein
MPLNAARPTSGQACARGVFVGPALSTGARTRRFRNRRRASGSVSYERRSPEANVLYRIVRDHLETFRAQAASLRDGAGLPRFVERVFTDFLRCGWLAGGFARFRCGDCGLDRLVAFSCKGRAVCPSCSVAAEIVVPSTTAVVFDPVTFLGRLAVLVPRPRINLLLYHGVLGARSAWRAAVVAHGRPSADAGHTETASVGDDPSVALGRVRNPTWAMLMRRAFGFDVLGCPRCGGRLRLVALIGQAAVVERILRHLGGPLAIPRPRPARAPPKDADEMREYAERRDAEPTPSMGSLADKLRALGRKA